MLALRKMNGADIVPNVFMFFIMLYPFVSLDKLTHVFKANLFEDERLLNIFRGLVQPDETKPFECVGTKEEINYALRLALEQTLAGSDTEENDLPFLLRYYKENYYNPEQNFNVVNYYNSEHNIPDAYLPLILHRKEQKS